MHHAIHAFGLAEILKRGGIVDVDDEHFWKFIDNTYIDDVSNLLLSVRVTIAHTSRSTKLC